VKQLCPRYLIPVVNEGRLTGREDREEVINSYWMTLRKREDTGILERNHFITEHSLWKRLWTCLQNRLRNVRGVSPKTDSLYVHHTPEEMHKCCKHNNRS
jgi:hypothetical protein